tara:strand:- start:333 stop:1745 length:1413 start_codon:yes stop_codon:yes gene_type:complete
MKAVMYVRVSTLDQDTDRQIEDLTKWADYKNLEIVKIYQDKISGFKKGFEDRESWNEMISYIDKNNISNILVSELSRISRRQVDLIVFVSECSKKGICIHIQKENLTTLNEDGSENSNAQMLISIISSMAQQESSSLSYRIKSGRTNAIKNGRGFSTKIYGYEADENGKPKIIEEEAKIVKRIFQMSCDGIGSPSIVNYLNDELEDKVWKKGRVQSILKNTFYYGKMEYNKEYFDVPKIITIEQYDEAQRLRESRSRYTSTRQHTNPFSGIIFCSCGAPAYQIVVQLKNIYQCKNNCGVKSVNRLFLIDEIRLLLERNAKLSKEESVREKMNTKLEVELANIKSLEREKLKIENRKDRNYEMLLDEKISEKAFNKFNDTYHTQISKMITNIEVSGKRHRELLNALQNEIVHYSQDIDIFKSQILNVVEDVIVHQKFAEVKIAGWAKGIIMIYRGQALIKYNRLKTDLKRL